MQRFRRGVMWAGALLALAGCGLLPGGAERVITGSGRVTSETRPVTGFTRVALEGSGAVEVVEGAAEALTIEAEDNILPLITSEVQGDTLRLGFDRATWRDTIRPTEPIRYVLTVRSLQGLDLSGSGSLHATSLRPLNLALHVSGNGSITIEHLESAVLDVRIDGTGEVNLAGQVVDQTVEISGSGQYQAGDLDSATARVTISGTGDAVVWVRTDLAADISGSGTVSYWGSPTLSRREIAGTGDVNPMGVK